MVAAFASSYVSNRCCQTHSSLSVNMKRLGDAVLLGRVRQDELLIEHGFDPRGCPAKARL